MKVTFKGDLNIEKFAEALKEITGDVAGTKDKEVNKNKKAEKKKSA